MSDENSFNRKRIVILHGVGMHGVFMFPMKWRLEGIGYSATCISYNTSKLNKERLFSLLDKEIELYGSVVLVGHSFGGIMSAQYIEERQHGVDDVSHLIMLGCPINGSELAFKCMELGLGWLLGDSYSNGLTPTNKVLDIQQPICSIAGTVKFGLRPLFLPSGDESDGTVSVTETRLDNLTEHHLITASHSSMIYQKRTIDLIHNFVAKRDH
ncbi:Cob(I)alamin adenosyltransferase [Vibrio chagasii]|nr:Cob(I)alamin adenosyltransferase [Vibrio chagasii]